MCRRLLNFPIYLKENTYLFGINPFSSSKLSFSDETNIAQDAKWEKKQWEVWSTIEAVCFSDIKYLKARLLCENIDIDRYNQQSVVALIQWI